MPTKKFQYNTQSSCTPYILLPKRSQEVSSAPCGHKAPAGTHVPRAGLHHGPVHVVGGQAGGGSEDSVSVRGFLLLFLLTQKRNQKIRRECKNGERQDWSLNTALTREHASPGNWSHTPLTSREASGRFCAWPQGQNTGRSQPAGPGARRYRVGKTDTASWAAE